MKVRDFISTADELDDICILTVGYRKLYYGRIMNMPEYLLDCSIVNGSLSVDVDKTNYPYFVMKVE